MTVKAYSPKRVITSVGGVPLSGFAEGSMVKIERAEDLVTEDIGADGEVAVVISANKAGTFTVSLQATSASNDYLTSLMQPLELGVMVPFPVSVVDASGRSISVAPECWVKKAPVQDFSNTKGTREWVIGTGNLRFDMIGGN